jgi:hypothetical protein
MSRRRLKPTSYYYCPRLDSTSSQIGIEYRSMEQFCGIVLWNSSVEPTGITHDIAIALDLDLDANQKSIDRANSSIYHLAHFYS